MAGWIDWLSWGVPLGLGGVDVDVKPARNVSCELGSVVCAVVARLEDGGLLAEGEGSSCWRRGKEDIPGLIIVVPYCFPAFWNLGWRWTGRRSVGCAHDEVIAFLLFSLCGWVCGRSWCAVPEVSSVAFKVSLTSLHLLCALMFSLETNLYLYALCAAGKRL